MDYLMPTVYAREELLPKLKDQQFFNRNGFSSEINAQIDSIMNEQGIDNPKSLMQKISVAPISSEVMSVIKNFIYSLYLAKLVENEDARAEEIYQILDIIEDQKLNKTLCQEIAFSRLTDYIMQVDSLDNLTPLIQLQKYLDSMKKDSFLASVFLQITHLVDISNQEVSYMSDSLFKLAPFAEQNICEPITLTFVENLLSKLRFHELIVQSANEDFIATMASEKLEKTDIDRAVNAMKKIPMSEEQKSEVLHYEDLFKVQAMPEPEKPAETSEPEQSLEVDSSEVKGKLDDVLYESETLQALPIKSWDSLRILERIIEVKNTQKHLEVFKCVYRDPEGNELLVAAKSNYCTEKDRSLDSQADFMAKMQYSKNFLKVYGSFWDMHQGKHRYTLVMEIAKETLTQRIINWEKFEVDMGVREECAFKAAVDLINSMNELNSKNISHRDIKTDNILITDADEYKIIDFDVSQQIERDKYGVTIASGKDVKIAGTMVYASPQLREMFLNKDYAEEIDYNKSDVYSLGLTILRMLTKENSSSWNVLAPELEARMNDLIDRSVQMPKLKDLIKAMLVVDPAKRPKFRELVNFLNIEEATVKDE